MKTFRAREKVLVAIILVAVLVLGIVTDLSNSTASSAVITVKTIAQDHNADVPPCPAGTIASSTAKFDNKPDPTIDAAGETSTKSILDVVDSSTGRIFEGLKFRSFHKIITTTSDDVSSTSTREGLPLVIIIRGKESSETICKAIQQKFLFCQMSTRSRRFSKLRIYSLSHVSFNQSTPQSNSTAQDTFPHNKDLYSNEVAHIKSSHK